MAAYWSLFCLPFAFRLFITISPDFRKIGMIIIAGVLILAIGLRDEVGCDWFHYIDNFEDINSLPLSEAITKYEPGHALINIWSDQLGLSVVATNFVYSIIFVIGLIVYSDRQPLPFFALLLAVPYLIVVVAMGYTRQATAIGCLFFALLACEDRRVARVIFWVVAASLFHRSALVFLALVPLARGLKWDWINIAILLCSPALFVFFQGDVDQYVTGYVESGMVSDGGFVRILLSATAGVVFFVFRSHFKTFPDYRLLFALAVAALISLPLNTLASTAVDRMALYLMPFQIAVFARVPLAFRDLFVRGAVSTFITAVFAAQLYVWLNYATNSGCWLPYRNVLWS